ncbi:MAG: ATP-binding protein [bacterium]|nr:ATP-binding protein [bacterium]
MHSDGTQEGAHVEQEGLLREGGIKEPVVRRLRLPGGGGSREIIDVGVPVRLEEGEAGVLRAGYELGEVAKEIGCWLGEGWYELLAIVVGVAGVGMVGIGWAGSGLMLRAMEREGELVRERAEREVAVIGAGIVHEVKNALNGIHMNAQLISESSAGLPEGVRERLAKYAERILHESSQTGRMLNEFLTYAKPAEYRPAPTNVAGLVEEVTQFFEQECRQRNIRIRSEVEGGLRCVRADGQLLRQALTNLVWNSIEAIGREGEIVVGGRREGKEVVLAVSDTGGGVAPELEGRIFDVFFSSKEHGAGLGLSIVQRVAEQHGGRVTLDNRPGQGCTFAVRFPWRE